MTALNVIHSDVDDVRYQQFLQKHEEVLRAIAEGWVQQGEALREMRDSRLWDTTFETFEKYVAQIEGISKAQATKMIRFAIVYRCLESAVSQNETAKLPTVPKQVEALEPVANYIYDKVVIERADGKPTTVKYPVDVKNETAVVNQWTKTVKEYERVKAKAEKEGKKPPRLSGKFIRNQLPNELKVTPDRGFNCNPLVRLAARLCKLDEDMKQQGFVDARKVPVLMKAEPPMLSVQIPDLEEQLKLVRDNCNKMLEILGEYE